MVFLLLSLTLTLGDPVEHIEAVKQMKPVLYLLPLASSRNGLPHEYERALALFEEAKRDYEQDKPEKAAPKFLSVAELVKAPKPETTYSKSFAQMRAVAYKDAALSFRLAGEKSEAVKALTAALKVDPENNDTLKALLAN